MKAEIELAKELEIPVRDATEVYQSPPEGRPAR